MALLSPMLLFVILLMSAAENQRKVTNVERAIPAKNDVVGTGPGENDVVGTGPAKNDVVGTGPTKNYVVGTGPAKNDAVVTGPAKNDLVGTGTSKNDAVGAGPAKKDVLGAVPAKNDVVGMGPAKNDLIETGSTKNNIVGTGPAYNDVLAFSAELSEEKEISPEGIIKFDKVLTNAGNMYYNTSGQFGCIDDALYVFVWNLMKASHSLNLGYVRCIGSLHRGGIDRKYGPKTSFYDYGTSGVSEMMSIQECSSSTPTAVTIIVQPWTTEPGSVSIFYPNTTSFSGFRLTSSIAFTAELSHYLNAYPGGRIKFDKVLANHGNHYDRIHSYFRCPDAGVYVFSVSTQTNSSDNTWSVSRLMMEEEVVMQGPITFLAYSSSDSGSSSSTTVLQCTPGLSVYVEAQSAYTFPYGNSYGPNLTSFTGFKLYDVTTETIAFTAVMSQNFTSASVFEPVPFDEVITNIGNAFDTTAGHFVCPDDAYYLFTWTAVADVLYGYMDLYMDESMVKELHTTYAYPTVSMGTSGSCTQSVILKCQPGSELQLRGKIINSNYVFLGGYTSFSGYKIPG